LSLDEILASPAESIDESMHDVIPRTAPRRISSHSGGTLHLCVQADMDRVGSALMDCPRARKIIDTVALRKSLPKTSQDAVLLTEVWLRLSPYIPFQDEPENIYSLIWRIAEFAAIDLHREMTMKEVRACDMSEEEDDLVIQNRSDENETISRAESAIDLNTAQRRFAEKLRRVGWDADADPTVYQGVTTPGRKAAPSGRATHSDD
jgi:hypothetical protein